MYQVAASRRSEKIQTVPTICSDHNGLTHTSPYIESHGPDWPGYAILAELTICCRPFPAAISNCRGDETMDFPQRVLIVDDDPIQLAVLKQIFLTHGSAMVETAANGRVSISIIENSSDQFDLIVLDLVMPEYDGIRLISYLESQNVKTRVLVVSGLPKDVVRMSNSLAEASGLTSIGCLQKPVHLDNLLEIVHGQRWPRGKVPKPESDRAVQPEGTWQNLYSRMTTA